MLRVRIPWANRRNSFGSPAFASSENCPKGTVDFLLGRPLWAPRGTGNGFRNSFLESSFCQGKVHWMETPVPQKVPEPPRSFEEFLKSQNWDYWPRDVRFRDNDIWEDTLKKLEEAISYTSIYSYLSTNVPRLYEIIDSLESKLKECSHLLQRHASRLFESDRMISKKRSYTNLERYKAFLKEHYRQKKIVLSDQMETEKNVEGCTFLFKQNELTQLPRHLDAKQIYLYVLRTHNFEENVFKVWRTYVLSDCSIALLHDSFWWWFLHKFKPDKRDEDYLFDRIAESYVTLFITIPLKRKDSFFQMYPDCLAQAIYTTFQESFPESSSLFNDNFKEDLGNTIFLWLTGLKPETGFWTHWKLQNLCTTTIHGVRRVPVKLRRKVVSSPEHIPGNLKMEDILKNPRAYTMPILKEESVASKATTKQSHYMSLGPEFYKVLFDFGGRSPLILYYLKMHELGGISVTHNLKGSKFTKILREPPPAPTYCDIIKEAKRKFADNKKDFKRVKQRIKEDIKFLKEQQEQIDKELDRIQAKASKNLQEVKNDFENFLHKQRVKAKLKEEYVGSTSPSESPQSLQSPYSALSFPTMSEDFNYVDSERHSRTTHSSALSV
ncbi:protein FAM227B isoform X3 [Mastomys coucha]|uniref:protein FAM227B isoform X3 n=1 Tax=Mastomys coucha TaxID=35658 RepID=UPI0012617AEE|nr:protein FAM227B isoform X3 [Mastomys coucha]